MAKLYLIILSALIMFASPQDAKASFFDNCFNAFAAVFNVDRGIEVGDQIYEKDGHLYLGDQPFLLNVSEPTLQVRYMPWTYQTKDTVESKVTIEQRIFILKADLANGVGQPHQATYFRMQLVLKKNQHSKYAALSLEKLGLIQDIYKQVSSQIWADAILFPEWTRSMGIWADRFSLYVPAPETLNFILDRQAKKDGFKVGPRFQTLNAIVDAYRNGSYSKTAFFEALLNGKVLMSVGNEIYHDFFQEHLIGGLLVSEKIFTHILGEARFMDAVSKNDELVRLWDTDGTRNYESKLRNLGELKKEFSDFWDIFTSTLSRRKAEALVQFFDGVFIPDAPQHDIAMGRKSYYLSWQHIMNFKTELLYKITSSDLSAAEKTRLRNKVEELAIQSGKFELTQEVIRVDVDALVRTQR